MLRCDGFSVGCLEALLLNRQKKVALVSINNITTPLTLTRCSIAISGRKGGIRAKVKTLRKRGKRAGTLMVQRATFREDFLSAVIYRVVNARGNCAKHVAPDYQLKQTDEWRGEKGGGCNNDNHNKRRVLSRWLTSLTYPWKFESAII